MDSDDKQARCLGNKRIAVINKSTIDNIREHDLSKKLSQCKPFEASFAFCKFMMEGNDLNSQDSVTGETFLHVYFDNAKTHINANHTRLVYMLGTKLCLDICDNNGDTPLHKAILIPGAWRWIVALMRCGACPFVRNKAGHTAEESILFHKKEGWEENLHWLRKFLPGLWTAVKSKNPDIQLIEKLLRYWCRTTKVIGKEAINLKCHVHMCDTQLDTVYLIEKYENTIELALAMLSGKFAIISNWKTEWTTDVDVNTKEFCYQYHYRDYPVAPRPLLMAVWEINEVILAERFMALKPDLSIKYTFESQAASPPKPLLFHLFHPKIRPEDEGVTKAVLQHADLSVRNVYGQTILMEAILSNETECIVKAILEAGVDLAARDSQGRTARDLCDILGHQDYKALIDSYVSQLIQMKNTQKLESLVLHMYDINSIEEASKSLPTSCDQGQVKKLFSIVKAGKKYQFVNVINETYSRAKDRAGRSLLHLAIQHSSQSPRHDGGRRQPDIISNINSHSNGLIISRLDQRSQEQGSLKKESPHGCYFKEKFISQCKDSSGDHIGIIRHLITKFPSLLHYTNNLGQTPLHYAHLYSASQEVIGELERADAPSQIKDVFDFVPQDYNEQECGTQTFLVRRKPTFDLDLDIFLTENGFEEKFHDAMRSGDVRKVKNMIEPLMEHHGEQRFSNLLFDCLDEGHMQLASYLIHTGFKTNIFKQYKGCDPDDPMCAMMECSHSVTSLRQRAVEIGAQDIVQQIDRLQIL